MANRYKIVVTVTGHDAPAEVVLDAAAELGAQLASKGAPVTITVEDTFDDLILDTEYPQ